MSNVSLKEYKEFKEKYVDCFFPKNLDTWSSKVLLETVNDKELMTEIQQYIDLCRNDITSENLDKLLSYLHSKIETSLEKVKNSNEEDKFHEMSIAMIYVGLFESIDELSSFCDNLIDEIKSKYGENYLSIIQKVDKAFLSVDGKKILNENEDKNIEDDLLNKYLVLKKWQDINHNFYYESIEPLLNEVEKNYIDKNNNGTFDFETPLTLQKLNYLNNKPILTIDELSKYYLAGLKKELVKIIGGKGYGLTILNSLGITIPETYVIPVSSDESTYTNLLNQNIRYSVRSSADIEDGEKNSFAGMFDSYLDVGLQDIDKYVKLVKMSKNNERVKKYVEHYNLGNPNMAIVVQKFIEPEISGVWIGNDLNSGVLEYTEGNGEKLVSGKVTPKREVWDKKTDKNNLLKCKDGYIGKLLLDIQRKIGTISDFEWMILDGKICMLQYRPVTSKIYLDNTTDNNISIEGNEFFSGIPASPGVVSGNARFINVRYIDKVNDWKKDDILMAWYTDPEWMNILSKSSGIVTAVGGFLCHSAIIARELGIPCVIGIGGDNMKKIWNEKELTIDGDNGKVYKGKIKTLKKVDCKIVCVDTNK